jgi:hypothetical protein
MTATYSWERASRGRGRGKGGGTATPVATQFTLSGSSSGTTGSPSTFWVTPDAALGSTTVVTLGADNGGTLNVPDLTFTQGSAAAQSFTVTRSTDGTSSVSIASSLSEVGSPISYTSSTAAATTGLPSSFDLITTATTGTYPFTLGMGFKKGNATDVALTGAAAYQVKVMRTWNDGSIKHAIVSGRAALTQNVSKNITVDVGTASTGTALTASSIQTAAPTASVQCGAFGTVSLASLLATPYRTFVSGHEMVECHYRADVGGGTLLMVWFRVRLFADGRMWVRATVENGMLDNGSGAIASNADRSYVPTVIVGGVTVYSNGGAALNHIRNGRWFAEGWIGGDPAVTATHDVSYLRATRLVPNYDWLSPSSGTLDAQVQTYSPFTLAVYPGNLQGGGENAHFGLLPNWEALYCTSGDARALKATVAGWKEFNNYGIVWRDATTKNVIKPSSFSTWSIDGPGAGGYSNWNNGWYIWDQAHNPAVGYLAYLLTGDFDAYETLLMNVATMWATLGSGTSNAVVRGDGTSRKIILEVRGAAWGLRSMSMLAAVTPDADLGAGTVATDYRTLLSNNVDFWKTQTDIPINGIGYPYTYRSDDTIGHGVSGSGYIPGWMENFWSWALGHGSDIDPLASMTAYESVRDFVYKGIVGVLGDNRLGGYHYTYASAYDYKVSPVSTDSDASLMYDDWGTVFDETFAFTTPTINDTLQDGGLPEDGVTTYAPAQPGQAQASGSLWGELLPSLAYAVDHGAQGAAQAYARITAASNWSALRDSGFANYPKYGIMPRLPAWRQGMAVNEWKALADSAMSDTPPSSYQAIGGSAEANKWNNWNGLSIDTRDDKLYALGPGGHGDYFGNEVMEFDARADAPAWVERLAPTPYSNTTPPISAAPRHLDDSTRLSGQHCYYTQQFIERHNRALRVYSGSVSSGPGTGFADVDGFNVAVAHGVNGTDAQYVYPRVDSDNFHPTTSGSVIGPNYLSNGNDIFAICKNPDTDEVWVLKQNTYLKKFTPSANGPDGSAGSGGTWGASVMGSLPAGLSGLGGVVTFNTRTQELFFACVDYPFSSNQQRFYSFNTSNNTWDAELTGSMSGAGLASLRDCSSGLGLVFVPHLNAYLAINHAGTVWKIEATTLVVTVLSTTGVTPAATQEMGGDSYATYENVYTRPVFSPALGGILYAPNYTADMHFLRLY